MNRFHEYIPQHRETVNRGRSVLCCKHRQNSSLIFKPSPFTFEVLHLTIPPCVTEQREPEHSVAITIQAAGRSRKPSSVAGLGCLSVRCSGRSHSDPLHWQPRVWWVFVKCCWWRKRDGERWSRGLQHPLMSRDNCFGWCGIKRPWMNTVAFKNDTSTEPPSLEHAEWRWATPVLYHGCRPQCCRKSIQAVFLHENTELFAPRIHLILLQFSVAGSAGSLFQWPLL